MATEIGNQHLLVDPTTQPIVPTFEFAPRIQDLTNKSVGMIDDSKENAKELLEEIGNLLRERFGVQCVNYHAKPSASKPADPQVIQAMADDCDFVIVAIGS
jgi:hypothetical protein